MFLLVSFGPPGLESREARVAPQLAVQDTAHRVFVSQTFATRTQHSLIRISIAGKKKPKKRDTGSVKSLVYQGKRIQSKG